MLWPAAILFLMNFCLLAGGHEWQVDHKAPNLARFTSQVIILTFHGETDQIDGFIYWEGEELFRLNSQLHFEVDLNSLDSGNGKRDRDMREILETSKWPFAVYEGSISRVETFDSTLSAYRLFAHGKMSIHGVSRELDVVATAAFQTDGRLHVRCRFIVNLDDYKIEAPQLTAFVKVSREIGLLTDFYLREYHQPEE